MSDERVAFFIDGSNLFHGLKDDFKNTAIDFISLTDKLRRGRELARIYYYTAIPDQKINPENYKKQQGFIDALRRKDYFTVVLGRLEKRGESWAEKGVDVSLAVDMLEMAFRDGYDTAIIVSGDADFARAVEVVKRLGKHVENAATPSCLSRQLQNECDKTIVLTREFLKDCWKKP